MNQALCLLLVAGVVGVCNSAAIPELLASTALETEDVASDDGKLICPLLDALDPVKMPGYSFPSEFNEVVVLCSEIVRPDDNNLVTISVQAPLRTILGDSNMEMLKALNADYKAYGISKVMELLEQHADGIESMDIEV